MLFLSLCKITYDYTDSKNISISKDTCTLGKCKKDNEKKGTMIKNKHQISLGNFSIKSKLISTKS